MLADSDGAALARVRIAQPASGKAASALACRRLDIVVRGAVRQPHLVAVFDQAARPDQAGGLESVLRQHAAAAPSPNPSEKASGSLSMTRTDFECGIAEQHLVAEGETEPVQQQGLPPPPRSGRTAVRTGYRDRAPGWSPACRTADRRRRRPSLRPASGPIRRQAWPWTAGPPRIVSLPEPARKASSASPAGRCCNSKRISPPRIDWPSLAIDWVIDRATELTPAMAAAPRAIQAMKMMKPESPPRISRSANRTASRMPGLEDRCRGSRHHAIAAARLGAGAVVDDLGRSASVPAGRNAPASAASWVTSSSVVPRSSCCGNSRSAICLPVCRIEIAGRLVGDHRIAGEAPGPGRWRRAAARRPTVRRDSGVRRSASPTAASSLARDVEGVARPASSSGTATFSSAVMLGIRWKDWNTMPILRPRNSATRSSLERMQRLARDVHLARIDAFQPGQHHQQGRFAGSGRADDADRFAGHHRRSMPFST